MGGMFFLRLFNKKNKIKYVYLDKDIDYIFCFKEKSVIEDSDCDYHEYNVKCFNDNKVYAMTHSIHTESGCRCRGDVTPLLNECDYCLKKKDRKKYRLSEKAINYLND